MSDQKQETKSEKPEVLAVVMARGGSAGLPGKALRHLLGRPVLAYTLDHVRESTLISRSVVSSDDPAILELARREGFEVIQRPAELATATSATDPVLRHAVRWLEKSEAGSQKSEFAAVVMLYGNVPVRRGGMIDRCIDMLLETGCDSVQTIAPVGKMHPYWMFDLDGAGKIKKHVPNDVFRRQDLPPLFGPTGAVYAMRTEVLMTAEGSPDPHGFLGGDRRGLVVKPEDSVDIDTERDVYLAEAILRAPSIIP
ncbi:MAG TPA: acylneuraminate cytidylyltransferase family protein [Phycisphaerae bacterium]|jgi:N-acylneuraminate cytidylyltransferase